MAIPWKSADRVRLERQLAESQALAHIGLPAAAAVVVGVVVLVGWAFDISALKSMSSSWVAMKPNTALAFVLTGLALLFTFRVPRSVVMSRVAFGCTLLAGLIGLVTLSEYAFGWNGGVDQWLFTEPAGALGTSHPGRMAPDTALCFLLLAAALFLAGRARRTKQTLVAVGILGALVTTVGLAGMLASLTPALRLQGWAGLTPMAPSTATLFAILGAAIVSRAWRGVFSPELNQFSTHLWRMVGCVGALAVAFVLYARSERAINRAHEMRYQSILLADELRHSGDDLTRMVRTYVITRDPVYKLRFQDILDIRDGKKPRPEHYSRPYWDLVLGDGRPPRGNGPAIALLDLMRQAGFTDAEFAKLAEAKRNSDALTVPEFEAMRLVETTGPTAEANRARARQMLFDARYHLAKAAVMRPIHDFFVLVDARTFAAVDAAKTSATLFRTLFAAFGLLLILVLWRAYVALGDTLGGSVDDVYEHIANIGRGELSVPIPVQPGLERSVLGWLSETQAKLRDINNKRLEAERWQQQLAAIVDAADDAIIGKTLEGVITSWNPGAARLLGYSPAEIIGERVTRLIPTDRLAEEARIMEQIRRGERVSAFESVRLRKDGSSVPVSVSLSPVRDPAGATVGVSTIMRDVTQLKRAEEALRESERRFRQLAEGLPQLVWTCTAEGVCDYLSPQWVAYTGIPEAPQLGGGWLEQLHPDDRQRTVTAWTAAVANGGPFEIEFRIRRADGVYRWFKTRATALRDSHGSIVKWFGTNTDIDDRIQAEQALARSNADLEQFAYVASHDLQEPLRMVGSYVQLLAKRYHGKLDADADEFIGYAVEGATRMQRLIEELLAYSRVSTRGGAFVSAPLQQAVDGAVTSLRLAIDETGATVTCDPLPVVQADPGQLERLMTNLIGNALKFRGTAPPRIHVGAVRDGGQWVLSVRDNGIGIESRYFDKIFVLFQRLNSRSEYPGTGMGLAIAKRIVERHNGRIWVESQPGAGSTFFFTLPATLEAAA